MKSYTFNAELVKDCFVTVKAESIDEAIDLVSQSFWDEVTEAHELPEIIIEDFEPVEVI